MTDVGLLTCAPHVAQIFCRSLHNPHFANSDHWTAPGSPAINQCYHLLQPPESHNKEEKHSKLSETEFNYCLPKGARVLYIVCVVSGNEE